MTVQQCSSAYI